MQKLYAIIDRATLDARNIAVADFARELHDAGVTLIQYRDKTNAHQAILRAAADISAIFADTAATLILNDRSDLTLLANFTGVHVGQGDLSPQDTRRILGPNHIIGISTHTDAQVTAADITAADYIAVGPVFATASKLNPEPVTGLEGVRRARALTRKPIVAIGGITRENARSVLEAGADSVAVIGALCVPNQSPRKLAEDFLAHLR
jgi:thiamine-phosphate pyrophosphorylase